MLSLVGDLGLEDDVRFLGSIFGEMKRSLFQAADVFALPTHQENFTESLACATPVLTTRGVDIWPELVESGGAKIVDRTPEAFADGIQNIVADVPRSGEMGRRGRAWVFDFLNTSRITSRFIDIYREVVTNHRS